MGQFLTDPQKTFFIKSSPTVKWSLFLVSTNPSDSHFFFLNWSEAMSWFDSIRSVISRIFFSKFEMWCPRKISTGSIRYCPKKSQNSKIFEFGVVNHISSKIFYPDPDPVKSMYFQWILPKLPNFGGLKKGLLNKLGC